MKYIIYQRVSTDQQEVETQEKECLNYIRLQEKGKIFKYNIFSDPETSSRVKMEKRLGLMKMLESLNEGYTLVVYNLDRLSRDVIEMVTIYREIKKKKCYVYSLTDGNCDDEFTIGLMGVLAQRERTRISERTKANLRQKKLAGERTGNIPYGYTIDQKKLVWVKGVDEQGNKIKVQKLGFLIEKLCEQEILSVMCELFEQGHSYRRIAKILDHQGFRNRVGKSFQHMSIYRILSQKGYIREQNQALDETEFLTSLQV